MNFKVGQWVKWGDYIGYIVAIRTGQLDGMVEVALVDGGIQCLPSHALIGISAPEASR